MVRKGLIVATVISAVLCGALLLFYLIYWPRALDRNAALLAFTVEQALEDYHRDHHAYPQGDKTAVMASLMGKNAREKRYLRPEFAQFLDASGNVVDSWNHPFRFDRGSNGGIKLRSAGANGIFGDADDLTSDLATDSP